MSDNKQKAVIIDVDGTLIDFISSFYTCYINRQFGKSPIVIEINKPAESLNALDLLSNSKATLDLVLFGYSVLSGQSYKVVKAEFVQLYSNYIYANQPCIIRRLKMINELGYKCIVKSNNPYGESVLKEADFCDHFVVISSNKSKRKLQFKELLSKYEVKYFVGNNYVDDIRMAKHLKVPSIYVGGSVLKKFFNADYYINSIEKIKEILAK
jgi:FMN phosphatase YigB (HAD superfamily)